MEESNSLARQLRSLKKDRNELKEKFERWCHSQVSQNEPRVFKRGRPKKAAEDKVQGKTIKLSPRYWEYLKNLSFGRGNSTRIRIIIDHFQRYQKREQEQLRLLQVKLQKISQLMIELASDFTNKKLNQQIHQESAQIRTILNILQLEPTELKSLLDTKQYQTFEFCLYWSEE